MVHLGNAYIECEQSEKREERMKFSLFTMGISVVSGALTTFGSGFWLIFPEFLFFKKFGILVMSVVTFSLFFSMVYFIGLLAKCGPQGKTGHIPISKALKKLAFCGVICIKEYVLCCCGTIDGWYDEEKEDKEVELMEVYKDEDMDMNDKRRSETVEVRYKEKDGYSKELIVRPSVINEVFSGPEMMGSTEIIVEERQTEDQNDNDNDDNDNISDNDVDIRYQNQYEHDHDNDLALTDDEEP